MDKKTFEAYAKNAKSYSQEWLLQPEPSDMYQLLKTYFIPQGRTADIGCGNGRDTNWLIENGYMATWLQASILHWSF